MGLRHFRLRGRILTYLADRPDVQVSVRQVAVDLDEHPPRVGVYLREAERELGLVESTSSPRESDGYQVHLYRLTDLGRIVAELPYVRDCVIEPVGGRTLRINQACAQVLRYAHAHPDRPVTVRGLMESTELSEGNTWEWLRRLREAGLMTEAEGSRAGRAVRAELLPLGREVAAQCADVRIPLTVFPRR